MLELKNVSAGYGQKQILTDVSLSFEKSKLVSVIGPNGSGKSTKLKSLVGLIPLISGQVYIDGEDISGISKRMLALKAA